MVVENVWLISVLKEKWDQNFLYMMNGGFPLFKTKGLHLKKSPRMEPQGSLSHRVVPSGCSSVWGLKDQNFTKSCNIFFPTGFTLQKVEGLSHLLCGSTNLGCSGY